MLDGFDSEFVGIDGADEKELTFVDSEIVYGEKIFEARCGDARFFDFDEVRNALWRLAKQGEH